MDDIATRTGAKINACQSNSTNVQLAETIFTTTAATWLHNISRGDDLNFMPAAMSLVLCFGTCYVILCMRLRYRFRNDVVSKFNNRPLSSMTDNEAHKILQDLNEMEFPAIYYHSLQIALFRTYGIPSISKLLRATTQLSTTSTVAKRYADTTGLITEMYLNPPSSERGMKAFARLNFLHNHYIKKGLISNEDMLYTLAMFMNHPVNFIDQYEWRKLSDVEKCAMGVWHYSMGQAMEIDFSCLSTTTISNSTDEREVTLTRLSERQEASRRTGRWRDGLHFYDALDEWTKNYEREAMVPDLKNHEVALKTSEFFKSTIPSVLHSVVDDVVVTMIDLRLRRAIMFAEQPSSNLVPVLIHTFVAVRKFVMKHLTLPRPEFLRSSLVSDGDFDAIPSQKRFFTRFEGMPYYVKPTLWNRWLSPSALYRRAVGLALPGDKGMISQGYLIDEFGPESFRGKGGEEKETTLERLRRERTGGCPFTMVG